MSDSLSREQRLRYAAAFWFAIHERDLTLALADVFADWWTRSGWMFHRRIEDGFANWAAGTFPRAADDED